MFHYSEQRQLKQFFSTWKSATLKKSNLNKWGMGNKSFMSYICEKAIGIPGTIHSFCNFSGSQLYSEVEFHFAFKFLKLEWTRNMKILKTQIWITLVLCGDPEIKNRRNAVNGWPNLYAISWSPFILSSVGIYFELLKLNFKNTRWFQILWTFLAETPKIKKPEKGR